MILLTPALRGTYRKVPNLPFEQGRTTVNEKKKAWSKPKVRKLLPGDELYEKAMRALRGRAAVPRELVK